MKIISKLPDYFDCLSHEEQQEYLSLRNSIAPLTTRTNKDQLNLKFQAIINKVQEWIHANPASIQRRALVCGIIRVGDDYIISTRQMTSLIGKCKSSVNSGFGAMGYKTGPVTDKYALELTSRFPFMKDDCNKMRQWTVRERVFDTPVIDSPAPLDSEELEHTVFYDLLDSCMDQSLLPFDCYW